MKKLFKSLFTKTTVVALIATSLLTAFMSVTAYAMIVEWKTGADNKLYWYEDGVKQGTYDDANGVVGDGTIRGREIYDPASDGWYWLDAIYDGAKACSKEVWMPYIFQNEADWDEYEMIINAAKSDIPGCVEAAITNKSGKWVRYDENGKMIKGWYTVEGADATLYPLQVGNTYYYDKHTGLMAKGIVMIEDKKYEFDEVTGALIREIPLPSWYDSHSEVFGTIYYDADDYDLPYYYYVSNGEGSFMRNDFNDLCDMNSWGTNDLLIGFYAEGTVWKQYAYGLDWGLND